MRESDWLVAGLSIVVFAVATAQASKRPMDTSPFVIDLRAGASDRVVLPLNLAPVAMTSLPAIDEASLFGIEVEPRLAELDRAEGPALPRLNEAPHRRLGLSSSPRRMASVSRRSRSGVARPLPVEVPQVAVAPADPAVAAVEAQIRRSRSRVALSDEPSSTSNGASLGFRLNERTSLNVGPMSSIVPSYAADAGHGDLNERWRLRDDDDASHAPGAAVGMTFKLN